MTPTTHPDAALAPRVRRFLTAADRFGTLATIDPDGWPHHAVVWFLLDEAGVVLNSREGRRWPANLRRDPRATLTVEDGYDYVTIRGIAELLGDADSAQEDIAAMARRYKTPDDAERIIRDTFRPQVRVSFLLRPRSVVVHGDVD